MILLGSVSERGSPAEKSKTCFFCETSSASEALHEASTFHLDTRVRQCALVLQDKRLVLEI